MNFNMSFLTSFLTVASTGSFTSAGQKLHLTQPAISQHIQALEEELGVHLFIRKGRGIILTEEGQILLKKTKEIQHIMKEVLVEIQERNELRQGKLRLAVTEVIIYLLPAALQEFKIRYPGVNVELHCNSTRAIVRMVAEGEADFAIARLLPFFLPTLQTRLIYVDRLVLAAPFEHPLAGRSKITAKDLVGCVLALRESGTFSREYTIEWAKQHKILTVETNTMASLRELALHGCLAFLPQGIVSKDFESKRLTPLAITLPEVKMEYYLYTHKNMPLSKAVTTFLDCLARSSTTLPTG